MYMLPLSPFPKASFFKRINWNAIKQKVAYFLSVLPHYKVEELLGKQ